MVNFDSFDAKLLDCIMLHQNWPCIAEKQFVRASIFHVSLSVALISQYQQKLSLSFLAKNAMQGLVEKQCRLVMLRFDSLNS